MDNLEKEIDDFFEESNERIDEIFKEIGFDTTELINDELNNFLIERNKLLKNFELNLFEKCSILKDLNLTNDNIDKNDYDLKLILNNKINKLDNDKQLINDDLNKLSIEKENLRKMLDIKSNLIKDGVLNKKEIERICNNNVKEEFVRLCKFMNLKFQWSQIDQKFTIVFLSDSSDINQVKQINSEKLLNNDQNYIKQLRDHFKVKVLQIIN